MDALPAAIVALAVTLCAAPAVLLVLRKRQIIDEPNERSSHIRPTARGGGLAPAIGMTVALLLSSQVDGTSRAGVLAAAVTLGVIGLVDDVLGLPAVPRLIAQVIVAASSLVWLGGSVGGPLIWLVGFNVGVVVWLVGYVNAFNFMDGINGISVAQVVVAGGAWWLIGRYQHVGILSTGGLVAAAGGLGFAPFNVIKPRMFLGDVGSYFLGGWLAAVSVLAVRAGVAPEAVLAPLVIYIADTSVTLVSRLLRHETLYLAHREHVYQRLVQAGWSHARTTAFVGAAAIACAALGSASLVLSPGPRAVADAFVAVIVVAYLSSPSLVTRYRAREQRLPRPEVGPGPAQPSR